MEDAGAAVTLLDMKLKLAAAATLLVACGGGTERGTLSPTTSDARGDVRDGAGGAMDIAGGETSEFSGGNIAQCPLIMTSEPLDLGRPDWAAWVARVEGRHESTLGWHRVFETDGIAGFEEHTSVVFDVNVLGGRTAVYGADGPGYELESCQELRAEQLDLEIAITTGDGAVVATYRDWFERSLSFTPDEELLVVGRFNPDRNGGVPFTGSLELDITPAFDGEPLLFADSVTFDTAGVRGALLTLLKFSENAGATALSGAFPDDACLGIGRAVPLDAVPEGFEQTPRELFQRVANAWQAENFRAVWKAPDGSTSGAPPATRLRMRAGEATIACTSDGGVNLWAPVTLVSADGRVNVTQPFITSLAETGGSLTWGDTPWLPASRFEAQMGIKGVDWGDAEYGSLSVYSSVSSDNDAVTSYLDMASWRAFEREAPHDSHLAWCSAGILASECY